MIEKLNFKILYFVFFLIAENLLCYDGPLIYEARCLERRLIDGKPEYLVHYKGWNESWEEWVDHTRLMKLNNKNIQKMISIKKE